MHTLQTSRHPPQSTLHTATWTPATKWPIDPAEISSCSIIYCSFISKPFSTGSTRVYLVPPYPQVLPLFTKFAVQKCNAINPAYLWYHTYTTQPKQLKMQPNMMHNCSTFNTAHLHKDHHRTQYPHQSLHANNYTSILTGILPWYKHVLQQFHQETQHVRPGLLCHLITPTHNLKHYLQNYTTTITCKHTTKQPKCMPSSIPLTIDRNRHHHRGQYHSK